MMRRVGLMTCERLPHLHQDDRLLIEPLAGLGIEAVPVVWSAPGWDVVAGCAALVLRSTWDYVHRLGEFVRWLDALEGAGVRLVNPPAVVRWNLDKRYLLELEGRGVPIIPTALVQQGTRVDLAAILRERGWSEALVKPTVSVNALGTWRVGGDGAGAAQQRLDAALEHAGALVQQFQRAVLAEGELSFVFFDRRFSHALRKQPRPGDFRVQEDHGGRTMLEPSPAPALLAQAEAVLDVIDGDLAYARVDGVVVDGHFLLMEVELAEPSLYLACHPPAAVTFAGVIARRL